MTNAAGADDPAEFHDEPLTEFLYRVPIGIVQTTLDGTIEMMNPMAAQLLMPLAVDCDLGNLFIVLAECAPELRERVVCLAESQGVVCEGLRFRVDRRADAPSQVLAVSVSKLDDRRLIATVQDATSVERREQEQLAHHLRHAARIDALTAMPNRAALRERVQSVVDREVCDADYAFAVLFINGDRFTRINDSYGHATGDLVLAAMAARLRATIRSGDAIGRGDELGSMAARVGGDEFVVLVEGLQTAAEMVAVAARLQEALARPYVVGDRQIHCSVSIGMVGRTQAAADADSVLQDASIAMHEAKRAGGARHVLFDASMRERAVERAGIEAELRVALHERQLFVVYQPVIGLRGRRPSIEGVEALVRWRHPLRGIVPPAAFIGVAEDCGLIGAIGEFVLRESCGDFVAWSRSLGDQAPNILAVNLSRAQLADGDLKESIATILRETGMPASRLQLEVTESFAARDEAIQARLHGLKALGLTIALDDFGTGYSSLSSLHLLPVDTVKIDRSFVDLSDRSAHHRVLIEATVRVARSLGMDTVAEGIETPAQESAIRALGCDKGQGYLFSRPLTGPDFAVWATAFDLEEAASSA